MTNEYEAPNPYASGLATLRAASAAPEALAGNDARTVAALKTAAAAAELKTLAINYGAEQIAARIIEDEHIAEFDRSATAAAARLNCDVSELRIAVDHDDIPPAPNGYDIALKALKETK